jgi:PE family
MTAAGQWAVCLRQEEHMSYVTTRPEMLASAAEDLQSIGSAVAAGNGAAAVPTTGVLPAAADEVSALTAAHFAALGEMYQAIGADAMAIHELFVSALGISGVSYAATEMANAASVD